MRRMILALGGSLLLAACAAEAPSAPTVPPSDTAEMWSTLQRLRDLQNPGRARLRAELAGIDDVTARLSMAEQQSIATRLRPCHTRDESQPPQAPVRLIAVFDALGMVRQALLADPDGPDGRNPPPERAAWIVRATRAVASPECNPLPLPPGVLGRPGRINLRVSP